ncbi:MAG: BCCT family transporter [Gammaproteobacteria bacterium]
MTQTRSASSAPTDRYATDHVTGEHNIQVVGLDIHNPVFLVSGIGVVLFVILTLLFNEQAADFFSELRPMVTSRFDWVFMGGANLMVLLSIALVFSPYGSIRLGGEGTRPEYSYISWISMLFAAGIGIGIMFYAVLEPMNHLLALSGTPESAAQAAPLGMALGTGDEAQRLAMAATLYHWAFHPWAIYAMVGLALAFFCYNKKLPMVIRSAFYPLLGERVWGWPGHLIDIFAVFATMFGLATSLGYGAEQAGGGLTYVYDAPTGDFSNLVVVGVITVMALFSVVRGLDGGIKRLSEFNMIMAVVLGVFVLLIGSTVDILVDLAKNSWAYLTYLVPLSRWGGREDLGYMHDWTTFYWSWWIAFSPFVGMFIARISLGRTVRQFIIGCILAPSFIFLVWMTVFGSFAFEQYLIDGYMGVADSVKNWQPELSLFKFLDVLPMAMITSTVGIVLVLVFFTTSMDSGSLILDTMTSGGKTDTPVFQRIFWCVFLGLLGIALLLGGGLSSLQALSLTMGLPFCLIILVMCVSLVMGLHNEWRDTRR